MGVKLPRLNCAHMRLFAFLLWLACMGVADAIKKPVWCEDRRCWSAYHSQGAQPLGMPKCENSLFDMLVSVSDGLKAHGLDYVLCWGTLLGALRNQDIIPWTTDIDFCLTNKSYFKVKEGNRSYLHTDLAVNPDVSNGDHLLRVCGNFSDGELHEFSSDNRSFVFADLYNADKYTYLSAEQRQIINGPKKMVTIRGRDFPAPAQAEQFLDIAYGSGWRTPDQKKQGNEFMVKEDEKKRQMKLKLLQKRSWRAKAAKLAHMQGRCAIHSRWTWGPCRFHPRTGEL